MFLICLTLLSTLSKFLAKLRTIIKNIVQPFVRNEHVKARAKFALGFVRSELQIKLFKRYNLIEN